MLLPALGFVNGVWLLQQCELLTNFSFLLGVFRFKNSDWN